jgi:hypothetical protein
VTVDSNTARGLTNQILYGIDRVPDLSDEAALAACADSILNQRHFAYPAEDYAEAIDLTVRAGRLSTDAADISNRFSEDGLLDFLARLARHLDERRPWPRPAFVKLDVEQWNTFAHGKAIAQIDRPTHEINGILNKSFDTVPAGEEKLPVMILELRSGDVVALMGSVDRRSTTFALLQRDPGDPAEVIARFCEFTGFPPEDVVPLAG